jgi:hypothetical protein
VEDASFDPANKPDAVTPVVTGVKEATEDMMFYLFPNFVTDELTVYGRDLTGLSRITDELERISYSEEIKNKINSVRINTTTFGNGIYFVEILSEIGKWILKFLKL